MKKYFRIAVVAALIGSTINANSQVVYDKVFVNNCAVLNMIPTTSEKHDFKDVIYIVSGADKTICGYRSVIVESTRYKENFGKFILSDEKQTALVMLNDGSTMRVGRAQVRSSSPKRIWIYPEYSAGTLMTLSGSDENPLALYGDGKYALVFNADSGKDVFYMQNGSLLSEDAYVQKDSKGRIIEIYNPGSFSIAGFFYGVSYNDAGNIASVKELQRSKEKNGAVVKKVKNAINFSWNGDKITKIQITDANGSTIDYELDVQGYNPDGVWTEAVLTHKDKYSANGKFFDVRLVRKFQ